MSNKNPRFRPTECKFCHQTVYYDCVADRLVNNADDPKSYHVDTCSRRKGFYHESAMNNAEAPRRVRNEKIF